MENKTVSLQTQGNLEHFVTLDGDLNQLSFYYQDVPYKQFGGSSDYSIDLTTHEDTSIILYKGDAKVHYNYTGDIQNVRVTVSISGAETPEEKHYVGNKLLESMLYAIASNRFEEESQDNTNDIDTIYYLIKAVHLMQIFFNIIPFENSDQETPDEQ